MVIQMGFFGLDSTGSSTSSHLRAFLFLSSGEEMKFKCKFQTG